MPLIRQEIILDREFDKAVTTSSTIRPVRFSSTTLGAPTVEMAFMRWLDMEMPAQIKVTIEPVP